MENKPYGKSKSHEDAKTKRYIEKLRKHIDKSNENSKYSLDRLDILIISLSTGALGFSISFIKDIKNIKTFDFLPILYISWILFATSIISNLIAQMFSYEANRLEEDIIENIIETENGNESDENEKLHECWAKILSNSTVFLNYLSLFAIVFGIVLIIVFICSNIEKIQL